MSLQTSVCSFTHQCLCICFANSVSTVSFQDWEQEADCTFTCTFLHPQQDTFWLYWSELSTDLKRALKKTHKCFCKGQTGINNQAPTHTKKDTTIIDHPIWSHTMLSSGVFFVSLLDSKEYWEEIDSLGSGMSRCTFWFVLLHSV